MADPFDEFEIKPLSEGLGFHKKSIPLSEQIKKSGLVESRTAQMPSLSGEEREQIRAGAMANSKPREFTDLLKALEKPIGGSVGPSRMELKTRSEGVKVTEPLPQPGSHKKRAGSASAEMEMPRPESPIFPSLKIQRPARSPLNKAIENAGLKRGAADSPVTMLERAPVAIPSAILDGIVVFALSLVFLVALMTVTKVDLAALVFRTGLDVPTRFAFCALFASVMMMYVVISRSFFGRTLGEWTFDYQMGDDQQHKSAAYPLRVLLRSILVFATGLIVLPLLSLILNRDLLAPPSGLQLYRQL
jgi:hypothetical protein